MEMIRSLLIALALLCSPILFFAMTSLSARKDVQLYRNPSTQKIVATPLSESMTDDELKKAFMDQNLWEYKLTMMGYLIGLGVMYIIVKWLI
jgi:hypothetical protein